MSMAASIALKIAGVAFGGDRLFGMSGMRLMQAYDLLPWEMHLKNREPAYVVSFSWADRQSILVSKPGPMWVISSGLLWPCEARWSLLYATKEFENRKDQRTRSQHGLRVARRNNGKVNTFVPCFFAPFLFKIPGNASASHYVREWSPLAQCTRIDTDTMTANNFAFWKRFLSCGPIMLMFSFVLISWCREHMIRFARCSRHVLSLIGFRGSYFRFLVDP
jgi:hypothetical protein